MEKIHIIKFLANSGVASRRKVEEMIGEGRVKVNGYIVSDPGAFVSPVDDQIEVSGRRVEGQPKPEYFLVNKPKGVVSTASDEFRRTTVTSLVKSSQRLYPVGRLDQDSSGLIVLTNDGELANLLTHPKYHVPKTYHVLVSGQVRPIQLKRLREGVVLKEGKTAPAQVKIINQGPRRTSLEMVLHEGKNRQIRRMCSAVGLNVEELKRVAIGEIRLGDLKPGGFRQLKPEEVESLKNLSLLNSGTK